MSGHVACGRCLEDGVYKVLYEAQPHEKPTTVHPFNLCKSCWRMFLAFQMGSPVDAPFLLQSLKASTTEVKEADR